MSHQETTRTEAVKSPGGLLKPLSAEELVLAAELFLRARQHGQTEQIWKAQIDGSATTWVPRVACGKVETGALRGKQKRKFERSVASAEDVRKDMVLLWRNLARGKGKKEWPKVLGKTDFQKLERWLEERNLTSCLSLKMMKRKKLEALQLSDTQILGGSYNNVASPLRVETSGWLPAYHGTWFYGLWSILHHGIFLESRNEGKGHEFWEPGVYVTRRLDTAREYARPHQLFGDGNFYRCVLKVLYNPEQVRRQRTRGGDQVVVPSCGVVVSEVFFFGDDPPRKGEERFEDWQDELEVIPAGLEKMKLDKPSCAEALEDEAQKEALQVREKPPKKRPAKAGGKAKLAKSKKLCSR